MTKRIMTNDIRMLVRMVCDGDIRRAQAQVQIILKNNKTQKDAEFAAHMLKSLENSKNRFIQLPENLEGILSAEDSSFFPESRYLLRETEQKLVERVLQIKKAASRLKEMHIAFTPTLMLYGDSGTGKTMLAKYIAHCAGVPYLYVRFSGLISSYLGKTQANLARIFDYAKKEPCVLCIDEIDTIAMRRGQHSDVGEMSRIVISLMQEMERLPNDLIVIGTTNRYEELDEALVRRFTLSQEIRPLSRADACALLQKFFSFAGLSIEKETAGEWLDARFQSPGSKAIAMKDVAYNQSALVKEATLALVDACVKADTEQAKEVPANA